jgi:hypothetical protein
MMKMVHAMLLLFLLVCLCGLSEAAIVHQYTFNVDGQAEDGVGTADLTVNGTATVADGALVLPGGGTRANNASAAGSALSELAATINGTDELTIEIWFTQLAAQNWSKLFMTGSGAETNYLDITPRRGNEGNVSSCSFRNGTEIHVNTPGSPLVTGTDYYIACVWDETTDTMRIYRAQVGNPASAVTQTIGIGSSDLAAIVVNQFYLGSAVYFGDGDFNGRVDEFRIHDTALSVAELEASYAAGPVRVLAGVPDPSDGQTLVLTDTQFSWQAPNAYTPVGYDVYIGNDPNVAGASQLGWTATTIDPAADLAFSLANNTTYYWRVDSLEPNTPAPIVHTGDVWSFTTAPADPIVTGDPVSRTVAVGTTIDLSVTSLNVDTYTWYRSADEALDPQTDIQVGTGATVQVMINGIAEEGLYYCVVSNGVTELTSGAAQVLTERLIGYWDFEGDLADEVASIVAGAPAHAGTVSEPNFVDGVPQIGGQGYKFYGDGRIVTIADSIDYFNFYPRGFTISCWVKDQNPAIWDTVCSKMHERELGWSGAKGFYLGRSDSGSGVIAFRPAEVFSPSGMITVDVWHQLTGVYDSAAGAIRLYVDGEPVGEALSNPESWNGPNLAPLIFGAESTDGTVGNSSATIDEVKIYSYALDSTEIAQQYVNVMGGYVCVGENPTADLSDDCQVNLDDLAILALNWLQSNRVEPE